MADPDVLADRLETEAARQLAPRGEKCVSIEDVTLAIDVNLDDVDMPEACRAIQRRGKLRLTGWSDGGRLPEQICL
jgi:hypothetical protein